MMNDSRFSVLAFPDSLNFYLNDEGGCKQEIQLFNVHDFTINFKGMCFSKDGHLQFQFAFITKLEAVFSLSLSRPVLCTSVDNYNVDPAFGSVRGGHHINM